MVMNGNDSGAGSLRDILASATSGSVIQFAAGATTINLNTPIFLGVGANPTTNLIIDGQGNVTITGQVKTSLFEVTAGNDTIQNLKLTAANGTDGKGNSHNGGAVLVDKGATLSLKNDTLKNNITITGSKTNGGAIENDGNLNVVQCNFVSNTADGSGGAIENTGTVNINGVASTFTGNQSGKQGGAIDSSGSGALNVSYATFYGNLAPSGGAISTATNTSLKNDVFGGTGQNQPNVATNSIAAFGGAVYATNSTTNNLSLTVLACQFIGNTSGAAVNGIGYGGGIYAAGFSADVEQSTFNQNNSVSSGGAIALRYGSKGTNNLTAEINLDTFTNNQSKDGGGVSATGSFSSGVGNLYLYNSTFYNNKAVGDPPGTGEGGAVYILDVLSKSASVDNTLTNDTFFKNTSDLFGGALFQALSNSGTGSINDLLTSLTVYQNTAASAGGGLEISSNIAGAVTLDNNILDGNTVTNEPTEAQDVTLSNAAALTDKGYNLVGTSDNDNFKNGVNNDILNNTTGLANQLSANGAPANYPQTLALTAVKGANSPGYETGDPNLSTSGNPLNQDERGKTRQINKVSIGAEDPDAIYRTATAVGSSVNPALPGQAVTLTASVISIGGTPTGAVTFYDGSAQLGTATLDANGNAAFATSSLTAGSHDIVATYGGDSNFAGSSGSLTQVVSQEVGSSMNLNSSSSYSTLNSAVTFTATIYGGNGTPTGTVTFLDGDTTLGTATIDGTGTATFTTSDLLLGSQMITAIYSGDATYGDNSATLTQTVSQGGTGTSLALSANPVQPGQPVTFTATIFTDNPGTPSGTVTYLDGTTALGTSSLAVVNGQNQATFTTSSLSSGNHTITAVYSGDSTFGGSSQSMSETVGSASGIASSVSISSSANASVSGQSVTFTASVTGSNGTPTGTITFLDGISVLGTATLDGSGNAVFSTAALGLGSNDIVAVYSGDGTYAGSGQTITQLVAQAASSTTLSSSSSSSPQGQPLTFTVVVASAGSYMGTPTGFVSFYDGTTILGVGTLSVVNGQVVASFTTAALGLGAHDIIAIYSGGDTFADSESSLTETITS